MWKPDHRAAADRRGLRYDSDLTDAEWLLVAPLIRPAKRGGRPRTVDVREVLNAIFYVLWTGCQWKALPKDLPPRSTVWEYLDLWDWDGTLERIHHALYVEVRENAGREASPTTAIIDSQTAKGAVKGGLRSTAVPKPGRRPRPAPECSYTRSLSGFREGVIVASHDFLVCGFRRAVGKHHALDRVPNCTSRTRSWRSFPPSARHELH